MFNILALGSRHPLSYRIVGTSTLAYHIVPLSPPRDNWESTTTMSYSIATAELQPTHLRSLEDLEQPT